MPDTNTWLSNKNSATKKTTNEITETIRVVNYLMNLVAIGIINTANSTAIAIGV